MSVVTATLLSDKEQIKTLYHLVSIDVRREVNRIPWASLVLLDGDAAKREFKMSDAGYFEPGKVVEVRLRWESEEDSKDQTLFKGPVVRHGIEAGARGSLLRLELKDAAVVMTQTRKSALFAGESDADVIRKLIGAAGGLDTGKVDTTKPEKTTLVQYYSTDWDFMLARAEANGLWVAASDGKVSARKANPDAGAKRTFSYGLDEIYDFEFELDAESQYAAVQASGWDPKKHAPSEPKKADAFSLAQGNLDGAKLAGAVGFGDFTLSHPAPLAPDELKAWADARMMRSRLALLRGRLATRGFADLELLDVIEVKGVGGRFAGKAVVTGICHRVDADGWRTDLQLGVSARAFGAEPALRDAPAAGLLPAIRGLHVGVVDKFEKDPDEELRVPVKLPGIAAPVWARLAAPDAGKNRGWFFRPEQGDEVVVGFFNDDPRQPVILGGLFGSKNVPPETVGAPAQENKTKGLVSRTGSVLGFLDDDKKGSVFIETASGARLLIDDGAKSIELSDQNGNQIRMDKDGIVLKSCKDLKLQADGNVEIKGAKVDIK